MMTPEEHQRLVLETARAVTAIGELLIAQNAAALSIGRSRSHAQILHLGRELDKLESRCEIAENVLDPH